MGKKFVRAENGYYYQLAENERYESICVKCDNGNVYIVNLGRYILSLGGLLYRIAKDCDYNIIEILGYDGNYYNVVDDPLEDSGGKLEDRELDQFKYRKACLDGVEEICRKEPDISFRRSVFGDNNDSELENYELTNESYEYKNRIDMNDDDGQQLSEFKITMSDIFSEQDINIYKNEIDLSEQKYDGLAFMVNDKSKENTIFESSAQDIIGKSTESLKYKKDLIKSLEWEGDIKYSALLPKTQQTPSREEVRSFSFQKGDDNTINNVKDENNIFKNNDSDSTHIFNITVDIPEFQDEVLEHLKWIINGIDITDEIRELIWLKSCIVLDDIISMVMNSQVRITKIVNPLTIADAIIICVIVSNKNMPDYKVNLQTHGFYYYQTHLKHLYPIKYKEALKFEFNFPSGYISIRDAFSSFFYEEIIVSGSKIEIDISMIVERLKMRKTYKMMLNDDEVEIMESLLFRNPKKFTKWLIDLGKTVKILLFASRNFKKIGAVFPISYYANNLYDQDVNFFKDKKGFYRDVVHIFKYLQQKYPDYFPKYLYQNRKEKISTDEIEERKTISRSKIKLYVIKHIYNGRYYKNRRFFCPECLKKGYKRNTDILRLQALEFHHPNEKKEQEFSAKAIYDLFSKNRHRYDVLDYVINYMESEGVILLCRNHHLKVHGINFKIFDYLFSFIKLLSYPVEIIRLLISTAVENHPKYKKVSRDHRRGVKHSLFMSVKKIYFIESLFGKYCHTCGEFPVSEFIPSFSFHHLTADTKSLEAYRLFKRKIPCSEILGILAKENGTYICSNCHTVYHYKYLHLLNEVYENQNDVNHIIEDYNNLRSNIIPINNNISIDDVFQSDVIINDNIVKYLFAISELQERGIEITTKILNEHLGVHQATVRAFFKKSELREQFLKRYVDIEYVYQKPSGNSRPPIRYLRCRLTQEGIELIKLISNIRDYYQNLENKKN